MKKILLICFVLFFGIFSFSNISAEELNSSVSTKANGTMNYDFLATSYDVIFTGDFSSSDPNVAYGIEIGDLKYTFYPKGDSVQFVLSLTSRVATGETKPLIINEYSTYGATPVDVTMDFFPSGYDFSIADPAGGIFHIYDNSGSILIEKIDDSGFYNADINDMFLFGTTSGNLVMDYTETVTPANVDYRINYGDDVFFTTKNSTVDEVSLLLPTLVNFLPDGDSELYVSINENSGAFRKIDLHNKNTELNSYFSGVKPIKLNYADKEIVFSITPETSSEGAIININKKTITSQNIVTKIYNTKFVDSDGKIQLIFDYGSMFEYSKNSGPAYNVSNIKVSSVTSETTEAGENLGKIDSELDTRFNTDQYSRFITATDDLSTLGVGTYPISVETANNGFKQTTPLAAPTDFKTINFVGSDDRDYSIVSSGGNLNLKIAVSTAVLAEKTSSVDGGATFSAINTAQDGQIVTYKIKLKNKVGSAIKNINIVDTLGEGHNYSNVTELEEYVKNSVTISSNIRGPLTNGTDYSYTTSTTVSPFKFQYKLFDLAIDEEITITYDAPLTSTTSTGGYTESIINNVNITSDDLPGFGLASTNSYIGLEPRVPVVKTVNGLPEDTVYVGDELDYKIEILNNTGTDLTNAIFYDELSAGHTFESLMDFFNNFTVTSSIHGVMDTGYEIGILSTTAPYKFSVKFPKIEKDEMITLEYKAFAKEEGILTNDAYVNNNAGDLIFNTANTVVNVVPATWTVQKFYDLEGDTLTSGQEINYGILIQNPTTSDVANFKVSDTLREGHSYSDLADFVTTTLNSIKVYDYSSGSLTVLPTSEYSTGVTSTSDPYSFYVTINNLKANQKLFINYQAPAADTGTAINDVFITSPDGKTVSDRTEIEIEEVDVPDIVDPLPGMINIQKSSPLEGPLIYNGTTVPYTVTIMNNLTDATPATDVVIEDISDQNFVEDSISAITVKSNKRGTLNPGSDYTLVQNGNSFTITLKTLSQYETVSISYTLVADNQMV